MKKGRSGQVPEKQSPSGAVLPTSLEASQEACRKTSKAERSEAGQASSDFGAAGAQEETAQDEGPDQCLPRISWGCECFNHCPQTGNALQEVCM